VFALVFRNNLGGDDSVGERRSDSMGGFGFRGHLVRNFGPLGALDEDSCSIERVIRGEFGAARRRCELLMHDVDGRRLTRLRGAALGRLILRVNGGEKR
jgi:hypothetical protein